VGLPIFLILLGAGPPDDPYPRRDGIDVEAYRFEIELRDDTDSITGRATVTIRFTQDGIAEIPLDLATVGPDDRGMEVSSVTAEGRTLPWTHEADLLTVDLPAAGRAGERTAIRIEYRGVPRSGLRIGPNKHGDRTFFSDNWPNRARQWLPTIDHIADKATNEFVVTAPVHYQVVSNGRLIEETDLLDGTRRTHWRQSVPISPWLYVLGVARFAVQHVDDFRGLPIQTWVYAQDREDGFYDFAVPTKRALEFYDAYVGPFAYEKLANITSPATGGGMEAATALMYSERAVTGERAVRWRNVIIHEVAHQWFANAVTESSWDDVWLSEGFATYFTLLFREHAYGRGDFVAGLEEAASRVWPWYEQNLDYRIVHDDLADMADVTSIAIYQKGAWVLHMLRKRVGDDAFWRGIQAYYAAHMNGVASTDDFIRFMEEASGMEHDVFFDQWLHQGGNPYLVGDWTYDPAAGVVQIELRQAQQVGTFDLLLEIGIYMDGGRTPAMVEILELSGAARRFTIPVPGEPTDVRLDPDTWLLFQADFGRRGG
jgi:aminopeptidase N